ncbi:hypothetical protein DPSP01_013572 [Paraphaeosphaeria sporulosa]|uniref:Transcription factor BYE1 n=1 Tax=Paraphaeosphaeria sporulosa TaxID=1460663 RepID=A0A177CX27_9PLEO|nr:uncharacterized protein CC84DRAFT_1133505 [Paraphaeosphaeria sporulosa]OAG11598.1 hypothetical protein CC84DRAFT_1133505 [Paraphaeosphaeria sporulosa]
MADEVRRSGRANKGHHTKNADALDEVVAGKPKSSKPKTDKKPKVGANATPARSQSAPSDDAEEEEQQGEEIIRCVCGLREEIEDDDRKMICCDRCQAWQHNKCLHLPEADAYWKKRTYYCEQCKPEEHQELLALMAKGEEPWLKWGKKGAKPPKSRPIDVKPGSKPAAKGETATPQPSQPAAPSPAAAPQSNAPSPAPPAPIAVKTEVATDGHAVAAEVQPTKPQSPLGEKRRHEPSEKEGASKKRRKPSAPKNEIPPAPTGAAEIDALPTKQKVVTEKLRETFIPLITAASESRGYEIPEGQTAHSIATRLALEVDHAAFLRHGEPAGPESRYSFQLRTILVNIRKNAGLMDQLLSGSLKADDIVAMSSEDMASDEKQREYARIRQQNEKQMILTEEPGPRYRTTHKGDELVENEAASTTQQDDFKSPPPPQNDEKPALQSPTQESHAVELPEDVGRREPIAVDTTGGADSARRPSTNFDINSVFAQVRSPQNDQHSFLQRRQSSIHQQTEKSTQVDADVDRLLKDEDGDVDMSTFSDETIVWRGSIEMQHMEPCASVARFVAGGDFGKAIPWNKLLSSTLPIAGRIEEARGDEYIRGLATTGSHDVAVLSLSPVSAEGRTVMDTLYKYFHDRTRWGVIPVDKLENEAMRDLYVIPVPAGPSNLPQFMDLLEHCIIETPRKEDMLLLALVAKLPDPQPLAPFPQLDVNATPTPVQATNGAGPSPSPLTNPHGPSYSPVAPAFPPNPYLAQQQSAQPNNGFSHTPTPPQPQAQAPQSIQPPPPGAAPPFNPATILGPYMASPVVQQLLQNPYTAETLRNLKDVLDKVPAAREDIGVLTEYVWSRNAQSSAPVNGGK